MKLVQMVGAIRELSDLLESDDLNEQQEDEARSMMAQLLDGLLPEKVEDICWVVSGLKDEAAAIKLQEERLAARRKSRENNARRLSSWLQDALLASGQAKVKTTAFTVSVQDNPKSVQVLDEAAIPITFWKMKDPELDKRAISEALKRGEEVPGCSLESSGKSLRIR